MRRLYNRRTGQVYHVGADVRQPGRYQSVIGADSLIGGDAIFGDDMGGSLEAQVAAARAAGGYVVGDKKTVGIALFQMLPFSRDFTAGEEFSFNLQPQRDFRCDNLIVTSPEGPYFELFEWTVGRETMLVAGGEVNCAAFSEGAAQKGLGMRGYTANQGTIIRVGIRNLDTEAHRFSAMFTGPSMMKVG